MTCADKDKSREMTERWLNPVNEMRSDNPKLGLREPTSECGEEEEEE